MLTREFIFDDLKAGVPICSILVLPRLMLTSSPLNGRTYYFSKSKESSILEKSTWSAFVFVKIKIFLQALAIVVILAF